MVGLQLVGTRGVPGQPVNLISAAALRDAGFEVAFGAREMSNAEGCVLILQSGKTVRYTFYTRIALLHRWIPSWHVRYIMTPCCTETKLTGRVTKAFGPSVKPTGRELAEEAARLHTANAMASSSAMVLHIFMGTEHEWNTLENLGLAVDHMDVETAFLDSTSEEDLHAGEEWFAAVLMLAYVDDYLIATDSKEWYDTFVLAFHSR
ncbi:hypothetical protein CYMTET_50674 [Cymbomonas tetramitiformis]|uniref:Uncharacterized protein n=1 Tax=Cymbomonas tetramitiformis TaxID=36881 RepID=A0AAE0BPL4_9CHLO|nr:hypothetical protein CYMTET_50674 [Cymbomonas tetramitiformis]